jgi:hypothetical protein
MHYFSLRRLTDLASVRSLRFSVELKCNERKWRNTIAAPTSCMVLLASPCAFCVCRLASFDCFWFKHKSFEFHVECPSQHRMLLLSHKSAIRRCRHRTICICMSNSKKFPTSWFDQASATIMQFPLGCASIISRIVQEEKTFQTRSENPLRLCKVRFRITVHS